MSLHPLAERFAHVADRYERGRPDYPPAVVGALAAELALSPGARVLDLAAGTGKLTRALLAGGLDVVAVEPQQPLRELLDTHAGAAQVLDGMAEAIPLAAASVDAVTVADAFHWFRQPQALDEIARVLRPGGGLALIGTVPDWREASWAGELGAMLTRMRPAHPQFDGEPWQQVLRAAAGWEEPWEVRVRSLAPADPGRIVDHVGSFSWIAALPAAEQRETLDAIRELIDAGETPARLPINFNIGLSRHG